MTPSIYKKRNGQVLLLTSLALGGTILAVTAIAGLLVLFQIRQATDIAASTRAIYAADSGIELGNYLFLKSYNTSPSPLENAYLTPEEVFGPTVGPNTYRLSNGVTFKYGCKYFNPVGTVDTLPDCTTQSSSIVISIGSGQGITRVLQNFLGL